MDIHFRQLLNFVLFLFAISFLVTGLYIGKSFFVPLTIAAVLAMLLHKISSNLENRHFSRSAASFFPVLLLLLACTTIITLIGWQLSGFTENMDTLKRELSQHLARMAIWLEEHFNIKIQQEQDQSSSIVPLSAETGKTLLMLVSATTGIFIDLILVFVYVFLFLLFRSRIKNFILMLVKNEHSGKARLIIQESTSIAQNYLAGLAKMIVTLWILYGVGFSLVGVENALFFAVACGLLEIVPFVGNLLGTTFTVIATLAQGAGSNVIIGVVVVYMLVQFVQTYILEPWIVGSEVRINPLFTIIGLVAGELIWGIAGMVLTIPILGVIRIVFDHIPAMKPYAYLIASDGKQTTSFATRLLSRFRKVKDKSAVSDDKV